MRVLLWSCGPRGDFEPLVALAVRLQALGVQVRMCAPPDCAERLAEVDVPLVPISRPESPGEKRAGQALQLALATSVIAEQFDKIPAVAQECDVVVASGLQSGAVAVRSVAEKLGIPYFYVIVSPVHLPTALPPALREQYNQGADRRFGAALNGRRAAIGLPAVENLFDFGSTDVPWLAADPVLVPLDVLPMKLDVVQTGAWILPDERPLGAELEAFLDAGSPPVYVGFGSSSSSGTADAARVAVEAIRAQGRRVVLSRGWAELVLPDDGDDCFAVGEVNLQVLFGRVAAVVHHGGGGTTHVATRAGVPQIVVRQIAGQFYYADRVVELGVGVSHDGPAPTLDSFSAALTTALSPEVRARSAAVAGSIRADGTTVAAELLFDAVNRQAPAVSV